MSKKYLYPIVAVIVLTCFIFIYSSEKTDNASDRQIRIGYNVESLNHASIIIAYEKQYFQKHGLSPSILPLKGSGEMRQALISGQIDIGAGGMSNFLPAMAKGAPIKLLAACSASPNYVFVRSDGEIRSFKDLYGKTVSVNPGGISSLIFKMTMNDEGVDTEKMSFTDIEKAYQVLALIHKKTIDATIVSEQDAEILTKAGAVVLEEWHTKKYDERDTIRSSIAVNSIFLDEHESLVEDYLDALIDAHRLIQSDPIEAARVLAKHISEGSAGAIQYKPEYIVKSWDSKSLTNLIWQDPEITMNLVRETKRVGQIDRDLSLDEVFDLRFAEKLSSAQLEIYGPQD